MSEVVDAHRAFEDAKQQRWQSLCSLYPGGPEGYRYVMEKCQKVGPRRERTFSSRSETIKTPRSRSISNRQTDNSIKKSIRKLLKSTRKKHAADKLTALESRRIRLSNANSQTSLDPKAKIVINALTDIIEQTPKFIEFVLKHFSNPRLIAQEPDPERRYQKAVSNWKGLPELGKSMNIKSHVLSMALNKS